jgi:hypothetical protein
VRTYEFWRERASGEVWAIELLDGIVVGSCGPLHWSEINPSFLRSGYEYAPDEGAALEGRREEFEPLDEAAVVLIRGSVD